MSEIKVSVVKTDFEERNPLQLRKSHYDVEGRRFYIVRKKLYSKKVFFDDIKLLEQSAQYRRCFVQNQKSNNKRYMISVMEIVKRKRIIH